MAMILEKYRKQGLEKLRHSGKCNPNNVSMGKKQARPDVFLKNDFSGRCGSDTGKNWEVH